MGGGDNRQAEDVEKRAGCKGCRELLQHTQSNAMHAAHFALAPIPHVYVQSDTTHPFWQPCQMIISMYRHQVC